MRSAVDKDKNKKQFEFEDIQDGLWLFASILIPTFVGVAIYERLDDLEVYWSFAIAVIIAHFLARVVSLEYNINEFYELPTDMQGKSYAEIVREVEKTGEIFDTYHYEYIKNKKIEMDNDD